MRKSFIMVYSSSFAPNFETVTKILDELDPHCDWHAPMEHCVLFTSLLSAATLAKHLENRLGVGQGKLFLISEVGFDKEGRLAERGWRVLNNPDNPRGA
jgi:hypothetical protein